MNYRHGFHAGNFADVLKHLVLQELLSAMQRKDKPFLFLDTHAGRGVYDLSGPEAQQTREHEKGVWQLKTIANPPPPLAEWSAEMTKLNRERGQTEWRYYPGSPELVRRQLRTQDRAVFCELSATEAKALQLYVRGQERVHVHQGDGYHAMKVYLPAPEKRALVMIDPPYESDTDDFPAIVRTMIDAHSRMANVVIALWYPIKTEHAVQSLYRALQNSGLRDIARVELSVFDAIGNVGLNGSGMIVLNPPFHLMEHMHTVLPLLWKALSPAQRGGYRADMLVPE